MLCFIGLDETYRNRGKALRQVAAEQLAVDYDVPEVKGEKEFRTLKGPYSPLEMHMKGKIQSLIGYTIGVEDDSVNSVMLDDQPEGRHERVLVAATVSDFSIRIVLLRLRSLCLCFDFFSITISISTFIVLVVAIELE